MQACRKDTVFYARSIVAIRRFYENVQRLLHEEQGSIEQVVARIKAEEYDTNTGAKQPEAAYLINLRIEVALLRRRRVKKTGEILGGYLDP